MKAKTKRTRHINICLTRAEYARIEEESKTTLCRHISGYARSILFNRPVITTYRNRSMDDQMEETIRLRKELKASHESYNMTAQILPSIHQSAEFKQWQINHAIEKKILLNKINEINTHFQKMTESWLL